MNTNVSYSYHYLFIGAMFLASSIRSITPFEVVIEWLLFFALIGGIYISQKAKIPWFAYICYLFILLYNPLFLTHHNINYTSYVDIGIGVLFFLMSLNWKKFSIST